MDEASQCWADVKRLQHALKCRREVRCLRIMGDRSLSDGDVLNPDGLLESEKEMSRYRDAHGRAVDAKLDIHSRCRANQSQLS